MKTKKLKKSDELKAKLIKLGCFYEFCENLKKNQNVYFEEYADKEIRKDWRFSSFINSAFMWAETPQGSIFWNDI